MSAQAGKGAGFDRFSSFLAWACAALVIAFAMAFYWLAPLTIVLVAPIFALSVLAALAFLLSGWSMIRRARWGAPAGLAIAISIAFVAPFSSLAMRLDFQIKRPAMEAIVAELDVADRLAASPGSSFVEVDVGGVALRGRAFLAGTAQCSAVFFPTFFGIPDGAAGFLYAPDCYTPSDFPSGAFGVYQWRVEALGGDWRRLSGT